MSEEDNKIVKKPIDGMMADPVTGQHLFAKGNTFGKGHKPWAEIHKSRFSGAIVKQLKPRQWKAIIAKAIEQAMDGDDKARTFLMHYTIGKPKEVVEATITNMYTEDIDKRIDIVFGLLKEDKDEHGEK